MSRYNPRTLVQTPSVSGWGKAAAGGIGVVDGYGTATGGIGAPVAITVGAVSYGLLTFTSDGTLSVSKSGLFDLICVGAGGGGGARAGVGTVNGGGGGAGGVGVGTLYLASGTYAITVGAGGAGATAGWGSTGKATTLGNAVVGDTVALGYGGGSGAGSYYAAGDIARSRGGSAGALRQTEAASTEKITGQGNNSGAGQGAGGDGNGAGGGGGGGAVGANGTSAVGGAGGAGFDASAWRGESADTTLVAGGGGGERFSGSSGAGGTGGGGAGSNTGTGTAGTANKGGGGGGGGNVGGAGGSGIFLIRFKI